MNNWLGIIQDWLYPPICLLCGDPGLARLDLCPACLRSLPYNTIACPRCGLPLASSVPLLCGRCQRAPPVFDETIAIFRYEEPVCHLIQSLKYRAHYPCARLLGTLLAEKLQERQQRPSVIIPVPLHRQRYRERGFNQAAEIAATVSQRLSIPMDHRCCDRIRPTQAQAGLPAKQRRKNLRDAFATKPSIPYRQVALLDDVVTTGTTVN